MNVRIPKHLEGRLRAHAERMGLSMNAAVTLFLDTDLPLGEQADLITWVDAQVPAQTPLPPGNASADELARTPLHPVALTPQGDSVFQVLNENEHRTLKLPDHAWYVVTVVALRLQIFNAPLTGRIRLKGPFLRLQGGPIELVELDQITPGEIYPLRTPVTLFAPDEIWVEAWVEGQPKAVVTVEVLCTLRNDACTGLWSPGFQTPETPDPPPPEETGLNIPVRVPILWDGSPVLSHPRNGKTLTGSALPIPWATWRVEGLEVLAGPDRPLVGLENLRAGGGINLFLGDVIPWTSYSPLTCSALRCSVRIVPQNRLSVDVTIPHDRDPRPVQIVANVLGRIVEARGPEIDQVDLAELRLGRGWPDPPVTR